MSISALEGNEWENGNANSTKDSLLEILVCPGCRERFKRKPDEEVEHRP